MYALAITLLINQSRERCPDVQQVWYATGSSTCTKLKSWWDELSNQGPSFGYYPNASKTYLVVKEELEATAIELFAGTDVHVTTDGKRHLGAALGSRTFTEEYVSGRNGQRKSSV